MIARRWFARLSVALIATVCMLRVTASAGSGELMVEIASLDASESGDVVAVVSVVDTSGRPVVGLTKENFVAHIGGETAAQAGSPAPISQITTAVNSNIGVAVVLAVDVSGSMQGDPLFQARGAARTFVEGLAPIDSVALVTFSDGVTPVLNFTTDRGAVSAGLDSLQAVGNTALYQAASVSAYVAASAQTQRKAVILLSDGVDFGNRSAVSREDSLTQAAAIGAPFFTIGLGSDIDRAYLEALAQGTGGRFLETPTAQGLSELYRAIGDFLRSQYVVTLSPGSLNRGQPLTLEIEVTAGEASGLARKTLPALETSPPTVEPTTVTVQGLASGAKIDAPVSLSVQVTGELPVKTLLITVDGSPLAKLTSPPYEVSLNPAAYATGNHVLRVEAIDTGGGIGATDLSFVAATPSSGGPSPGLLAVGVVLLLLAVAGAVVLLAIVRRRPRTPALATRVHPWSPRRNGESEPWQSPPSELTTLSDEPLGRLIVAAGPRQGETLEVGARPRRLGSSPRCDLVLENEDGSIAPEEARVWVSEERLTYHKLTRLTTFASDGPVGGWFILQHGDEIQVGPYRLVFELLAPDESDDSIAEALAALEQADEQTAPRRKRGRVPSSAATDVQSEDGRKPEMLVDPTLTEDIKPTVTEDTDLRLTEDVDAGAEGE
jgi:VWFA-related protein